MSAEFLYRAQINRSAPMRTNSQICAVTFEHWCITKKTPKGWHIERHGIKKWTSGRFASPDKDEAIRRLKLRRRSYAKHSLDRLIEALKDCERIDAPMYRDCVTVSKLLRNAPLDYYNDDAFG